MVIFCSLLVALSLAETFRIPLASISKVTSTWGTPRGAGGIPSRMNRPNDLLSPAISLSPCKTLISTEVWLSAAVEKTSVLEEGMVVLRLIKGVLIPPIVSIPKVNGVTSSSNTSLTSPPKTPPWIAAPIATTSSGLIPLLGSLPKKLLTATWTAGMRVMPPTSTTSPMSLGSTLASFNAALTASKDLSIRSETKDSSFERESLVSKCLGPEASAVTKGMEISVSTPEESSTLAFSAASRNLCSAWRSFLRSIPSDFWNSSANQSIIRWSKSSPPRWVSPLVDLTSKTPSPSSSTEISKVPPPRS